MDKGKFLRDFSDEAECFFELAKLDLKRGVPKDIVIDSLIKCSAAYYASKKSIDKYAEAKALFIAGNANDFIGENNDLDDAISALLVEIENSEKISGK